MAGIKYSQECLTVNIQKDEINADLGGQLRDVLAGLMETFQVPTGLESSAIVRSQIKFFEEEGKGLVNRLKEYYGSTDRLMAKAITAYSIAKKASSEVKITPDELKALKYFIRPMCECESLL